MPTPLSPPPIKGSGARELPAYLSNGLIGLRVREAALSGGMALLSGYSGEHPERRVEAAAPAPYPLAADLSLGGVWYSDVPQRAADLEQSYDFGNGELTTSFTFSAGGRAARVSVLTFCSRPDPTLVCQEITVELDGACDLALRAVIDGNGVGGHAVRFARQTPGEPSPVVDGSLLWRSAGGVSACGVALVSELVGPRGVAPPSRPDLAANRLTTEYALKARGGRKIRLRQIASLVPEVLHIAPDHQATRLAAKARAAGFDSLRASNRAAWAELWKGRIELRGASQRWQALADAAVFYLNSSVSLASPASTSIFGLATWHDYHYYYGHVMWDIETFAVPPLALLQPHAARALLDYRSEHLDGARRNARIQGRRGLQFPWESAPGSGEEAAPLPAASAWHEDHVSLDVARAFSLFADVTGDAAFLREKAWPVLSGVAEWLASRVSPTQAGYDIDHSMGIAEREQPVCNAAFTNMSAVVVLRAAQAAAARLGLPADPHWESLARGIAIPRRGKAVISHDAYRVNEEKGATPDPLMGVFPLGFPFDEAGEAATLALYLATAEAYIGSPMLSALYGAWAARTGDRALALRLLDEGYGQFCVGRFLQTLEYRADRFPEQPPAGPFFANIGGFLISLLFGFTGLEPGPEAPEAWSRRAVNLPEGWSAIEIERVWIRGQPMRLTARQGERASLEPHP